MFFPFNPLLLLLLIAGPQMTSARYIMYLTGQHPIVPSPALVSDITHVALAFLRSSAFNIPNEDVGDEDEDAAATATADAADKWPLFTTVDKVRSQFAEGTKVMIAIGGWGDTEGFSEAVRSEEGMRRFARNVKAMVDFTGADGVDIDWEYPGGNGEDYKTVPNALKAHEIPAYPLLLSHLRSAMGPSRVLSAAVPGLPRDMLAFTATTVPAMMQSLDFVNVMTYDLMNRRDSVTKHHTGIAASLAGIDAYLARGLPPDRTNLGFGFYVKYFRTDPAAAGGGCRTARPPVGCPTALLEDPITGADLGQTGGFSWHDVDASPPEDPAVAASFARALRLGTYDAGGGGHYYWDGEEDLWWTWDTAEAIARKVRAVMVGGEWEGGEEEEGAGEGRWGRGRRLGGVFAWGLGEDGEKWTHLKALGEAWKECSSRMVDAEVGEDVSSTVASVTAASPARGREEL